MYVLVVKKDDNRFLAHGSISRTYLIKNADKFLDKPDGTRYKFVTKDMLGAFTKNISYVVVRKLPDGSFYPVIVSDFHTCRDWVKNERKKLVTMQELKDWKYNIVGLTCNNYDDTTEDTYLVNNVDELYRIRCTAKRRSSGEYDIYTYNGTHLGYVDTLNEVREFFNEPDIWSNYYCSDI